MKQLKAFKSKLLSVFAGVLFGVFATSSVMAASVTVTQIASTENSFTLRLVLNDFGALPKPTSLRLQRQPGNINIQHPIGAFVGDTAVVLVQGANILPASTYRVMVQTTASINGLVARTLHPEPISSCSPLAAYDVTSHSMLIMGSPSPGASGYLVIYSAGPVPEFSFDALADGMPWGSTLPGFPGSQVAYSTQPQLQLENLPAGTPIQVAMVPVSSQGGQNMEFATNYRTSDVAQATFRTKIEAPTSGPSTIAVTEVGSTVATITVGAGGGNGRVIILSPYPGDIDLEWVDMSFVSNVWMSDWEQAVYLGVDDVASTVTVTNLNPETIYYVTAFECNIEGDNDPAIFTDETLTTSFTTEPFMTFGPDSELVAERVGYTIRVSWKPGEDADGSVLLMNTDDVFSIPAENQFYTAAQVSSQWRDAGEQVVYFGPEHTVVVTNVDPFATYHFYAVSYLLDAEFPNRISYNSDFATGNPLTSAVVPQHCVWTGAVSSDWHSPQNWKGGLVPRVTDSVEIFGHNVAHHPVMAGDDIYVHTLVMRDSARLTQDSGHNLHIGKDMYMRAHTLLGPSFIQNGNVGPVDPAVRNKRYHRYIPGRERILTTQYAHVGNPTDDFRNGVFLLMNAKYWDEPTGKLQNIDKTTFVGEAMRGYAVNHKKTEPYYCRFDGTRYLTGDQTYTLESSDETDTTYRYGINLIANPYPCAIDWRDDAGWSREGVDTEIQVYNPEYKEYWSYNRYTNLSIPEGGVTGVIAPCQSFLVHTYVDNNTITINENARLHGDVEFFDIGKRLDTDAVAKTETQHKLVRIQIEEEERFSEAVILFHDEATGSFSRNIDIPAVMTDEMNEVSRIFVAKGHHRLVCAGLPTHRLEQASKGQAIEVTLEVRNRSEKGLAIKMAKQTLGDDFTMTLLDKNRRPVAKLDDAKHRIGADKVGNEPFILRIEPKSVGTESARVSETQIYTDTENVINIVSDSGVDGTVKVSNMQGATILESTIQHASHTRLRIDAPTGVYVVTLAKNDGSVLNEKVLLK